MLKKDARILFNKEIDENNKRIITRLSVVEFKHDDKTDWPLYLYKNYSCDIGNCEQDWDKITLAYIINYFMANEKTSLRMKHLIILELYKIDEWKEEIEKIINCTDMYYSIRDTLYELKNEIR